MTKKQFLAILLLSLLYLHPLVLHPNHIPMTNVHQVTDFTLSHLSYANYIHRRWILDGHPPLWNSSMLSGTPLITDPLSGYFYIPNWLTFIFPLPAAFNVLFVLHLVWTGCGMFLFTRKIGILPESAFFSAAVWMGTPKLIGYIGGGQVSSVFALCWLPWLYLVFDDFARSLILKNLMRAAVVLSTILLVDVRWGFLCGAAVLLYFFGILVHHRICLWKGISRILVVCMIVILLTAGLTFPLIEFMAKSDRATLSIAERAILSLDITNLFGIFTPQLGIVYELITYGGIAIVPLAIFGIKKQNLIWLFMILLGVFFSLGDRGFLFPLVNNLLPGFDWLRVPSRAWFFVIFSWIILASYGLNQIMIEPISQKRKVQIHRISVAVGLFAILLMGGIAVFYPPLPSGILVFGVMMPLVLIVINFLILKPQSRLILLIVILSIIDLTWVNKSFLRSVPLEPSPPVVKWLESQSGLFRVYSPSYNIVVPNQLQTAEGVNPLRLRAYSQFMAKASGVESAEYSVSVPAIYLDQKSPSELFEKASTPNLDMLGLLNVKYIASNFPMKIPIQIKQDFGNVYLYLNPSYRERVWIEGSGSISIVYWSPDFIVAEAKLDYDQLVIFSEIDYPGWVAKIDEQTVPIQQIEGLLRGVQAPAGRHIIELRFVPLSFYIGLCVCIFGWMLFLYLERAYVASLAAKIRRFFSRTTNPKTPIAT